MGIWIIRHQLSHSQNRQKSKPAERKMINSDQNAKPVLTADLAVQGLAAAAYLIGAAALSGWIFNIEVLKTRRW
jgi:hypothetical protein